MILHRQRQTSIRAAPPDRRAWSIAGAGLAALLGLAGFAGHACAGSAAEPDFAAMSIEELGEIRVDVVYGASKHEQKVREAPSAVSIVQADEIKLRGDRTLADVLRGIRGFYVSADRNYGYIGVRGFNRPGDFGGRILILVDGHRVNEPIYDSAFNLNDFLVDLDLVERVEVIRGAGSSLYGDNAFFAVINVVTRDGRGMKGFELAGSAGSYDSYRGRLTYGNRFTNGLELLLSGTLYDSAGPDRLYYPEFDQPQNNDGVARRRDGEFAPSGLGSVSYGDFRLRGGYITREKEVPTAAFGTIFNDGRFRTVDTRGFASLEFAREFSHGLAVRSRVYYDRYEYDADYPVAGASPGDPSVINRDRARADWAGVEVQASGQLPWHNRVTGGAEFRRDLGIRQRNADVAPPQLYSRSDVALWNVGIFAQDEFTPWTNVIFNLGLRYDRFSQYGDTLNPRAAIIYSPLARTTVKLLYGQAYRVPSANEYFYESPFQKTNPQLAPERIRSWELALEQGLPANFGASVNLFHNATKDLITQRTDPGDGLLYYDNLDQASTYGAEGELSWRAARRCSVTVSYAYQETRETRTDEELSNSPRHLAKLAATVPIAGERLFASLELQYSSLARTLAGRRADGYILANVTLFTAALAPGLEVSASIYNLLDQRYGYPGAGEHAQDILYQDGRTFRLKLVYQF